RRHTRFSRDWSSDVCSSALTAGVVADPLRRRDRIEIEPAYDDRVRAALALIDHVQTRHAAAKLGQISDAALLEHLAVERRDVERSEERRVGAACGARRGPER